jgi:hypothetical protein
MKGSPHLVQARLFDHYIAKAVALTLEMWGEVATFLGDGSSAKAPDFPAPAAGQMARLSLKELSEFRVLGAHWNLDCGLSPRMGAGSGSQDVAGTANTTMHVPGQLSFQSVHESVMDDVAPFK